MNVIGPFQPEPLVDLRPTSEPVIAFTPDGLPEVPGGWAVRRFDVAGQTFDVTLPADPDAFLDAPDVLAAHETTGYMPYWGYLWPTSLEMAAAVLQQPWEPGTPALEIGSGIGLVGLAGLAAGLRLTFSDYDRQSVRLALLNAVQNGWSGAEGLVLDWRQPLERHFPVILGCDVTYEVQNHGPILDVLDTMLAPGGQAWLADPGRHQFDAFVILARTRGYTLECRPITRQPYPGRPEGNTNVWVLSRK